MQAACVNFTQDHHVAAALFVAANVPPELPQCLGKAGVVFISGGLYMHDHVDYRELPMMVSPYEVGSERAARTLLSFLFSGNYVKTGDHVGVMIGDWGGSQRAYSDVIEPGLKARHVTVTSYTVKAPTSTPDIANEAQQVQSAELRMRADGVTTVMFFMPGPEALFMNNAESQGWRPRYALTTYDSLWGLVGSGGAPAAQLKGAVGVGWQPTSDIGTYGVRGGPGDTPARRQCRAIEKPTGQVASNPQELIANQYCDAVLYLQAAANAINSTVISGSSILKGFSALGSSQSSAVTFSTFLSSTQHDGAATYRPFAFGQACGCFQYTGGPAAFAHG
jgi:hypothetical protein